MEHLVSGCKDCPFRDSASGEYSRWCNHPNRPRMIGHYEMGQFYEHADIQENRRKEIITMYDNQETATLHIEEGSIWVDDYEIKTDDNYDPITPDLCPLNKEQITIKKE